MKRFFYSGCSFTDFPYPTWGDIIAYDLITTGKIDHSVNLARGGACNYFIYHSFLSADVQHKFTDDDILGVCWTSPWRHSLLCKFSEDSEELDLDTVWHTRGNVAFHPIWPHMDNHLDYINTDAYLLERTASSVLALNKMYDFTFQMKIPDLEGNRLKDINLDLSPDVCLNNYIQFGYQNYVNIPDYDYEIHNQRPPHKWVYENHPTPLEHLSQACKLYDISDDTITEVKRLDELFNHGFEFINDISEKDYFFEWQDNNYVPALLSHPVWGKIFR